MDAHNPDGTQYMDCQCCPVTQNMSNDEWERQLSLINSSE